MSRARQRKQEEKITFLQENPELVDHDAVLAVEGPDQFGRFGPTGSYQGNPYFADGWLEGEIPGDLTLYGFVFGGAAQLNAFVTESEIPLSGSFVSTSALGFGVADPEEAEGIGFGGDGSRSSLTEEPVDGAKTLDEGELLMLDITTPKVPKNYGVEDGPDLSLGATGVSVDFLVIGGSGAVELFGGDSGSAQSVQIGPDQAGQEDTIAIFGGPDDPFNAAGITVIGDLEITVTGINYSLNFEPMFESI